MTLQEFVDQVLPKWFLTLCGMGVETSFNWPTPLQSGTLLPIAFRAECDNDAPSADAQQAIVGVSATNPASPMNAGLTGIGGKNQVGPNVGVRAIHQRSVDGIAYGVRGEEVGADMSSLKATFALGADALVIRSGATAVDHFIIDLDGWRLMLNKFSPHVVYLPAPGMGDPVVIVP